MAEHKKSITWTAAAATLLVAIVGWAASTSSRVSALEASQAAHAQRIEKAEKDADEYRQSVDEIRDRLARIEGYFKRLAQ